MITQIFMFWWDYPEFYDGKCQGCPDENEVLENTGLSLSDKHEFLKFWFPMSLENPKSSESLKQAVCLWTILFVEKSLKILKTLRNLDHWTLLFSILQKFDRSTTSEGDEWNRGHHVCNGTTIWRSWSRRKTRISFATRWNQK